MDMVAIPGIVDKTIGQLSFQVRRLAEYFQRDNWFRRQVIEDIAVSTTAVTISHRLGYVPEGYLVTKKNANVTVYNGDIDQNTITLQASGNATISILIW
jgi:hypothetical protein